LIKVLDTLMEIVEVYNKLKQILAIYSQIPDAIFQYFKDIVFRKKDK